MGKAAACPDWTIESNAGHGWLTLLNREHQDDIGAIASAAPTSPGPELMVSAFSEFAYGLPTGQAEMDGTLSQLLVEASTISLSSLGGESENAVQRPDHGVEMFTSLMC